MTKAASVRCCWNVLTMKVLTTGNMPAHSSVSRCVLAERATRYSKRMYRSFIRFPESTQITLSFHNESLHDPKMNKVDLDIRLKILVTSSLLRQGPVGEGSRRTAPRAWVRANRSAWAEHPPLGHTFLS